MGVPPGDADRVLRLSGGWETAWGEWEEVARRTGEIFGRLGVLDASKQAQTHKKAP